MPLPKRRIHSAATYADPSLHEASAPADVLDATTFAEMTGVLSQLGFLATYATDLFNGLFQIAKTTHDRISKVDQKIRELKQRHEESFRQKPTIYNTSENAGKFHGANRLLTQELFTPRTRDSSVAKAYKECMKPPSLHLVDDLQLGDGDSCLARYSNPNFFYERWLEAERERQAKEQQRLQAQRERRRAQRQHRKQLKQQRVRRPSAVRQLNSKDIVPRRGTQTPTHNRLLSTPRVQRNTMSDIVRTDGGRAGGERAPSVLQHRGESKEPQQTYEPREEQEATTPKRVPPPRRQAPPRRIMHSVKGPETVAAEPSVPSQPEPEQSSTAARPVPATEPPTPDPLQRTTPTPRIKAPAPRRLPTPRTKAPEPQSDASAAAPSSSNLAPSAPATSPHPQAQPMMARESVTAASNVEPDAPQILTPVHVPAPAQADDSRAAEASSAAAMPKASPAGAAPAPAPRRNFLMDVQNFKKSKLKSKVGVTQRKKPVDPRNNLLSAIRGGGTKLKKVDREKVNKERAAAQKAAPTGGGLLSGVAAILANRVKITGGHSSSESDSDWTDEDDYD